MGYSKLSWCDLSFCPEISKRELSKIRWIYFETLLNILHPNPAEQFEACYRTSSTLISTSGFHRRNRPCTMVYVYLLSNVWLPEKKRFDWQIPEIYGARIVGDSYAYRFYSDSVIVLVAMKRRNRSRWDDWRISLKREERRGALRYRKNKFSGFDWPGITAFQRKKRKFGSTFIVRSLQISGVVGSQRLACISIWSTVRYSFKVEWMFHKKRCWTRGSVFGVSQSDVCLFVPM